MVSQPGFEEVLSSANVLNRKLEEVYGVGKEFQTVANLWGVFFKTLKDERD
jgi:DASH complex subunit DAD1